MASARSRFWQSRASVPAWREGWPSPGSRLVALTSGIHPRVRSASADGRIGLHTGKGRFRCAANFLTWSSPGFAMTNALATDAEETWAGAARRPQRHPRAVGRTLEALDLPVSIGGQLLEDFDAELSRVELRRLSYLQKMALVLSRRAWADSGLARHGPDPARACRWAPASATARRSSSPTSRCASGA